MRSGIIQGILNRVNVILHYIIANFIIFTDKPRNIYIHMCVCVYIIKFIYGCIANKQWLQKKINISQKIYYYIFCENILYTIYVNSLNATL